jgi:hypothetical protein
MCGAQVDGPMLKPGQRFQKTAKKTRIWRSPTSTRKAASDYLSAAALAADDDPQRLSYIYYAILNMCHSGHIAIADLLALGEMMEQCLTCCESLFGDDEDSLNPKKVTEIRELMKKLRKALEIEGVTPSRRLKPCPDYDAERDTTVDAIKPELFEIGEDEANWRTPDGKFIEINPIFREYAVEGRKAGWVESTKMDAALKGEATNKVSRNHGHDDWTHPSYMEFYKEVRITREKMKREAIQAFEKAKSESSV